MHTQPLRGRGPLLLERPIDLTCSEGDSYLPELQGVKPLRETVRDHQPPPATVSCTSPHRAHTGSGWVYSHWDSRTTALSPAALPAVPDLQLLLTLDLPLQLQDAVEERLGCGRAAWGTHTAETPSPASPSPHGGLSGHPGVGLEGARPPDIHSTHELSMAPQRKGPRL